jgi:hypothetical protein
MLNVSHHSHADNGESMRKPSKEKEWPQYSRGPKESLHAIAVLILNFNAFETALFKLFAHHLVDDKAAFKLATKMFFSLPERNRLDFIKLTFSSREKDAEVKLTVSKLLKYFEWCQHARNHFAHSRYDPSFFKTSQDEPPPSPAFRVLVEALRYQRP